MNSPRSRRWYRKFTCSSLGTWAEWTAPGCCINYSGADNHQRGRYTAVHRRGPGRSKLKTTLKGVDSHSWTPRLYPPIAQHGNKLWKMLEVRRHLQQRTKTPSAQCQLRIKKSSWRQWFTFVFEGNVHSDLPKRVYVHANHYWSSFTYRRSEYKVFYDSLQIAFPNNVLVNKFRGKNLQSLRERLGEQSSLAFKAACNKTERKKECFFTLPLRNFNQSML